MNTLKKITAPVIAALLVAGLSACSSDSSDTTPADSAPPAATESAAPMPDASVAPTDPDDAMDPSADPSEPMAGGDPSTWSPTYITPETVELNLVPGQVAILDEAVMSASNGGEVTVTSSDEMVVIPVQPGENTAGGINAVAAGEATVSVTSGDTMMVVKVVVEPAEVEPAVSE